MTRPVYLMVFGEMGFGKVDTTMPYFLPEARHALDNYWLPLSAEFSELTTLWSNEAYWSVTGYNRVVDLLDGPKLMAERRNRPFKERV